MNFLYKITTYDPSWGAECRFTEYEGKNREAALRAWAKARFDINPRLEVIDLCYEHKHYERAYADTDFEAEDDDLYFIIYTFSDGFRAFSCSLVDTGAYELDVLAEPWGYSHGEVVAQKVVLNEPEIPYIHEMVDEYARRKTI